MNLGLHNLTSELTDVALEYDSAKRKHGEYTLDERMGTDDYHLRSLLRLGALMEEVGEVAEHFTYDKPATGLRQELIQVANLALTWASVLVRD